MENTTDTPIEGETTGPNGPTGQEGTGQSESTGKATGGKTRITTTELRRPRSDRMLAGVASGIAHRVGVDPWVIRLAFLILSFGGGSGILLYIAGWLLIPEEGEAESVGQRWANQANSTRPWVGVLLVVVAAAILFSNFPFFDGGLLFPTALLVIGVLLYRGDLPGWKTKPSVNSTTTTTTETITAMNHISDSPTLTQPLVPVVVRPRKTPSPLGQITVGATVIALGLLAAIDRVSPAIDADARHYFALAVSVVGIGILVGAFYGRARWLIPLGLLLVPAMVGSSVAASFDGDWSVPQVIRPAEFSGIASLYERGAGRLVIDLTDLPWTGQSIAINAELGVGELELRVPSGVGVEATGDVGIGEFDSALESEGGFGIDRTFEIGGDGTGMVVANLEVGIGRLAVVVDGEFFDGQFPSFEGEFGDLVIDVNSTEALEDSYTTLGGDISLDLSGLVLTEDRTVEVRTDIGEITVTLPAETSYRVVARTDTGIVDLFGDDQIDRGGTVRADSISNDNPVIELDIQSLGGNIILKLGERS